MMKRIGTALLLVLALTLVFTGAAYAQGEDPQTPRRAVGEITSVDIASSSFALAVQSGETLPVVVDEDTTFRSLDGSVRGIGDLEAGMLAHVAGTLLQDGTLLARVVGVARSEQLPSDALRARGEIVRLIPGQEEFILETDVGRQLTFQVTPSTRFASPDGSVQGFDDLEKGMRAAVLATSEDEGGFTALAVLAWHRHEIVRMRGEIQHVNLQQQTFGLKTGEGRVITFYVTESTRFRSVDGSIQGLEDLEKGMVAIVGAYEDAQGDYQALVVAVGEPEEFMRVGGEITAVAPADQGFSLETRDGRRLDFLVGERTRLRSPDGLVQGLEDLEPGMLARVAYVQDAEGGLHALLVTVASKSDFVRLAGEIIQVIPGQETFSLRAASGDAYEFCVSARTRYRNADGSVQDIHDLKKDMLAAVTAVEQEDGTLLALLVVVRDKPQVDLRVRGLISAIGSRSFTMRTAEGRQFTFNVDGATVFRSPDGSVGSLEDLQVGMGAVVLAKQLGDGQLKALVVGARAVRSELPENTLPELAGTQIPDV
jgi:hypothetical protein